MLLNIGNRSPHVLGEDVNRDAGQQALGAIKMPQAVNCSPLAPAVVEQLQAREDAGERLVEVFHRLAVIAAEYQIARFDVPRELFEPVQIGLRAFTAHNGARAGFGRGCDFHNKSGFVLGVLFYP